ncbi:RICIN domain-containing protein [Catenovulum maritimum]|uniref:RICIN domain-containing protein n=1 Tax=Catenovulum maritimum TaxID=1513271 RepID=UPI00069F926D|nr:RICIN domain-containing protein [Catenovulum maritimum]
MRKITQQFPLLLFGTSQEDKDYTGAILDKNQYNMDEEAYIIIDTKDHSWRSEAVNLATDADLADDSKNKMYVDWIRVYEPIDDNSSGGNPTTVVPTGITNLQAKHSNTCLDVANGAMWNGSTYQQWGCNTANANQQFTFTRLGNSEYTIQSNCSGLCIELKDGSTENGATVHQWVCNHSDAKQRWELIDQGEGYYKYAQLLAINA